MLFVHFVKRIIKSNRCQFFGYKYYLYRVASIPLFLEDQLLSSYLNVTDSLLHGRLAVLATKIQPKINRLFYSYRIRTLNELSLLKCIFDA